MSLGRRICAAAPLVLLLTAARGYDVREQFGVIRPLADAPPPGSEMAVRLGEPVLAGAIAKAPTATLDADLSLDIAGQHTTLLRGSPLHAVSVSGDAATTLPAGSQFWCADTSQKPIELGTKGVLGAAAFGLLGGAPRTRAGSSLCLVDGDGDGRAERAFQSGAQRDADLPAVAIEPVPLTVVRDQPIEGLMQARIVFARAPTQKAGGALTFNLAVTGAKAAKNGRGEFRASVRRSQLPQTVDVEGARFTVLSYDDATMTARNRIDRPLPGGPYWMTPTPRYTYIPVYVPH